MKKKKPWCFGGMDVFMRLPCDTCEFEGECYNKTFDEYMELK